MNSTTSYTPLETLLLFQSLVAYGIDDQHFIQISDHLTNNPLVKDGETYDAQRLTADALRELFLQLLCDELRAEDQEDGSPTTTKKRKLQSPPLPSIKDAQEHRERLPILVDRLYARYRDYMVRAIEDDERRYAVTQKEIDEIERGEWDERILMEEKAMTNGNGTVSAEDSQPKTNGISTEPLPQEKATEPTTEVLKEQPKAPSPVPSPPTEVRPEGLAINDVLNNQEAPPPSSPKLEEVSSNGSIPTPLAQPRPSSNGPHGPSPLQPPPAGGWKWEQPYAPPHQPPPYQPNGSYPQFNSPQYPPQGYPPPPRGSFSAPHGLPPPHPHVPSSPINQQHPNSTVLPPPNSTAVRMSPNSPGMPLDALADIAGQQYRATSGSPLTQQGPPPGSVPQPFPPQPWPPSTNGPPGPPQWNQQYMPPYNGPPQPFQFPPNQRQPFPPQPNLIQPENRQYNSPYNASQGPRPPMPLLPGQTPKSRPNLGPNTPISSGQPRFTTGSGTRWTPTPTGVTPKNFTILEPPPMEPISPVLRPSKLPEPPKKVTKKQAKKSEAIKPTPASRRGAQRMRAGSAASSVIAGSHRSQSVMSHADELSLDTSHPVKEEVATPMGGIEDIGDTTADEASTLPKHPPRSRPSPRPSTKRKRASSIKPDRPSGPATHVLWTRNFPKISISALESISGHRNASTFAAPVKERDAPGYKKLVLRPQDLKSIRSAITAGHRAATAAAPEDLNPNASSVWLPISEDLVPPKGIINYAQFEKELMRMFANAVMFNADPDRGFGRRWHGIGKGRGDIVGYEIDEDSIVKDTRAMFKDTETIVGSLRSAERRSEEMRESSLARASVNDEEVDELAGDGEPHAGNTGSIAKRRRKA